MPVEEGTPEPQRTRPAAREILAAVALAAVGFLLTAGVLHAAIRDPLRLHADFRSEKLVMLEQWHGKVFSAAFGTSHLHNGFDPRVFDSVLAGSPAATHTANLAVEGGSQAEQYVMAQQFLKQLESPAQAGAPPQPCLVLLELNAGANFTSDHLVHPRAINIYDWPTTQLITHFASPAMGASQRYGRTGYALTAMGLHYANVGMLSNEIFAPPLSEAMLQEQTADDSRGLSALPYRASIMPHLHSIMAGMPQHPSLSAGLLVPGNAELVERLAAMSPVANLSFVYVVMPKLADAGTVADYPDSLTVQGLHVPIINLNRSDRFPEMFNPEIWFDDAHFDGDGAKLVTRIFATQLKQWYAEHGGPQPCG